MTPAASDSMVGQLMPIDEWPDYADNEDDNSDDMHDDGEDE